MFINITIEIGGLRRDIRIDSEQKIKDGIVVLWESNKIPIGILPDYFRSRNNQRPVSSHRTFADEIIFDGDILTAIVE